GEKIPIGIFYVNPHTTTLEERLARHLRRYPQLSPANSKIEENGRPVVNQEIFERLFKDFIIDVEGT
ncbi:MAG: 2-oxoacid:ferredoxin oxidoreductase subunit beta, partial [Zestosphaera sp.]